MCTEIETLEGMRAWDVLNCNNGINFIISTWYFKLNQYPDGLINNSKARFCDHGYMQLEKIDKFESYTSSVQ